MARATTSSRTDDQRLQLFADVVEECVNSRAVRDGTLRANVSIRGSEDGEVVEADFGDIEDVRSLMLSFRKLIDNEDANFYRVCKLVDRRVRDLEVRDRSRQNRAAWKEALATGVAVMMDGRVVGGEAALDVWINGVLFHSDPDDRAWYGKLSEGSAATFQFEVQSTVVACLRVAHFQRNLVNHVIADGLLKSTASSS